MQNVAILPTPLARAALAGSNPRNAATCGLYDIAGRLGQAHRSAKWLTGYVDQLIAGAGFPKPYPLHHRGKLVTAAHGDSRWCRPAVDLWFDDQIPTAARDVGGRAERVEVDSRLSANLHRLFEGAAA